MKQPEFYRMRSLWAEIFDKCCSTGIHSKLDLGYDSIPFEV